MNSSIPFWILRNLVGLMGFVKLMETMKLIHRSVADSLFEGNLEIMISMNLIIPTSRAAAPLARNRRIHRSTTESLFKGEPVVIMISTNLMISTSRAAAPLARNPPET